MNKIRANIDELVIILTGPGPLPYRKHTLQGEYALHGMIPVTVVDLKNERPTLNKGLGHSFSVYSE
jgi:hypothetical protein